MYRCLRVTFISFDISFDVLLSQKFLFISTVIFLFISIMNYRIFANSFMLYVLTLKFNGILIDLSINIFFKR